MKRILLALLASAAMCGPSLACAPPLIGDVFKYNDGTLMQLRKLVGDCSWEKRKQYMCPVGSVGSTQGCRWMTVRHKLLASDGFPGSPGDGDWLILYGDDQTAR